jgi:hypothetical protein
MSEISFLFVQVCWKDSKQDVRLQGVFKGAASDHASERTRWMSVVLDLSRPRGRADQGRASDVIRLLRPSAATLRSCPCGRNSTGTFPSQDLAIVLLCLPFGVG